jgi:hypothetical protein
MNSVQSQCIAVAVATLLTAASVHGEGGGKAAETGAVPTNATVTLRVVDLYMNASNVLCLGTNRFAAAQLTNRLALYSGKIDAIAVHGGTNDGQVAALTSEMLGKVARLGLPLLVVEEDGSTSQTSQADDGETRTVTLNSDHLVSGLRQIGAIGDRPLPSLRAELGLDEEGGTRDLNKLELGLPESGIWLLHEADKDGRGVTGIQIKKSW